MSLTDNQNFQILILSIPDEDGHFGPYGGRFVSETSISALDDLQLAYSKLKDDAGFQSNSIQILLIMLVVLLLYIMLRWQKIGGAQIFLKGRI